MGMYTGVRFKAKLKPLVSDAICLLFKNNEGYGEFWFNLSRIIPIDSRWLKVDRRDFIPYGAMSYMPDDWIHLNEINQETRVWEVCCSLKNYADEIGDFLVMVLPFIIDEPCRVEELYEEDDEPTIHMILPQPLELSGI